MTTKSEVFEQAGREAIGAHLAKAVEQPPVRLVQIGTVSVDSGMVMIVDPAYVSHSKFDDEHPEYKGPDVRPDYDKVMDLCYEGSASFQITEKTKEGKILIDPSSAHVFNPLDEMTAEEHRSIGYGTVCATRLGDGTYPVYAVYKRNRLVGMEVRFE